VLSVSVRDDLRALEGYHSPQVDVAVRLNTNESPEPPPVAWVEALSAAVRNVDWHRYPDRSASRLRARLATHHGVDPAQVFVANGSNEVLQVLLLAYGGHGRTVVTFEPTYQLHGHIARLSGARVVEGERRADFSLDPSVVQQVVASTRPDVVFLCSPNNPTGLVEPPDRVETLLAATTGLVVVDEAYGQFASWSAVELVDDERPMVVVRTFSKTWSMAAARLGYLIGPRQVVAELDKVTLPYHLDALKQIAGELALDHEDAMRDRVERIVAERERVVRRLAQLPVDVVPSGANFVLFRPTGLDGNDVWQGLLDRGVLVRNCANWARLEGRLRVTIGTRDENDAFLTALEEVLRT
jgi:histidinol-phosphate aminotransferase